MPSVRLIGFVEHDWGDKTQRIGKDGWSNYNAFESFLSIYLMKIIFMLIVSSLNYDICQYDIFNDALLHDYCLVL